ncbi:MAG: hypothetical protein ABIT09_00830 [Croceibacterium sp.]
MHGTPEIGVSRYVVLYFAQICWLALGAYLATHAVWPSSCLPTSFMRAVSCSIHLPDNRGWVESAFMTWLWTTPMLIGLEVSRRLSQPKHR